MNRETDTVFLQTLGRFIQAQIQLAAVPLLQKMNDMEKEISRLKDMQDISFGDSEKISKELDGAIEGFSAEISRVEKLIPEVINGKDGNDGKDAIVDYDMINHSIKTKIEVEIGKFSVVDGKDGKDGIDGKDAVPIDYDAINECIWSHMEKQIAKIQIPKDGKDGKDADMEPLFAYVENYMKAIPIPQNGKDGQDGKDGTPGRDGADVVSAFRDSDQHLILTLSNGATKDIGLIHGQDGKDGINGTNGRDGVSYDQVTFTQNPDDPLEILVTQLGGNGEVLSKFRIPGFVYKGVWEQANKYRKGDAVTLGGSLWFALDDTEGKPEISKDWHLAVKRGREGKPGEKGDPGSPGKHGRDGRDLTQMGPDGSKW
jgi:hypothetical protein